MPDYLEADLTNFVDRYVTSFLAWDLIVFFHKNPGAVGGAGELANKFGRRVEEIDRAAQELVDKAVLRSDNLLYGYDAPEEIREMVRDFVGAIADREKRILILTKVLKRRLE